MSRKLKIMYVDDETINLQLFKINFRKEFDVVTSESGAEALDKLHDEVDFNVIISDMSMPGMNGIEFVKKAREILPDVSFYILTGFDISEEISEALNAGIIRRYFNKPYNMRELAKNILDDIGQ